jgi:hypothetical protein
MNEYKVSFTLYRIIDGKISVKNHFSYCSAVIYGETFEDAVSHFSEVKRKNGWAVRGVVEGDPCTVTIIDLDET